jgi:hypothetical protein
MRFFSFVVAALAASATLAAKPRHAAGPAHFALELAGKPAGWLISHTSGSAPNAETTLAFGAGMSKDTYGWIQSALAMTPKKLNVALIATDFDHQEISRNDFQNALITDFEMPACDASSKDPAHISIKFKPETAHLNSAPVNKGKTPAGYSVNPQVQKKWLAAYFKVAFDNAQFKMAAAKIAKIDPIIVKQKDGKLTYSNLVIHVAENYANAFYQWHEAVVIKGASDPSQLQNVTLQYLATDQKPLFTLRFQNVGLKNITPDRVDVRGNSIRRLKVEMFFENVIFDASGAAR